MFHAKIVIVIKEVWNEPLPVKRTVKNQKIFATSNRNVAGCFLWRADTVSQSLQ